MTTCPSYSDSQKYESSCFLSDRLWCISPEPFELQKIFLLLLASLFEELSDKKGNFSNSADFAENTDFSKKKSAIEKNPPFWKNKENIFMDSHLGNYIYVLFKFIAKDAHATSSN